MSLPKPEELHAETCPLCGDDVSFTLTEETRVIFGEGGIQFLNVNESIYKGCHARGCPWHESYRRDYVKPAPTTEPCETEETEKEEGRDE